MEFKDIIKIAEQYNNTDKNVIKNNIIKLINESEYNRDSKKLADKIGVSIQTIYSYRKMNEGNIPDFVTALKLVNELNIKINDLMEG
jgi:DNA-binding XRE family transcriptional regulator